MKHITIIGGGFSGLAAAVALSERGHNVLLLERRPHLGGRAYSFLDAKTGDSVDNGQHLFMACYRETISFLRKIGCLGRLRFQPDPQVDLIDPELGPLSFKCPPIPAPLHALAGLARMRGLTTGDKVRALRVGLSLLHRSNGTDRQTVAEWLSAMRQSTSIIERFWRPMVVATLNLDPQRASARMLDVVLRSAFRNKRTDACLGVSTVGLSDLYTQASRDFIESRGGVVRTSTAVRRVVVERGQVSAAELSSGEIIKSDYFISAVPPQALLSMFSPGEEPVPGIGRLSSSPIVSINLWFDRPLIDREFVGVIGKNIQWLFNKEMIVAPGNHSHQIAIVISAAHRFIGWQAEQLVEMALNELGTLVPQSLEAHLTHSRVIKEPDATIAHTVESDDLRPGPLTSLPNFILAGDWTNTGLPATIESAVMSGHIAASLVD